ncbi:SubName: Full=Related to glycosyltransferase family 76 protein-Laccaria bicolor {ECO:0000313/EMBL:CCA72745.1} [Serendipita indica DSM 11827]|nr:SubName: Full=Related to glycosyltransferase family 76 protein-Laccaria bicolor {ECO:0000313/EMBL:CCA72745.1} [Serendipita indica DSM 11827]
MTPTSTQSKSPSPSTSNLKKLLTSAILYKICSIVILFFCTYATPFDASHLVIWPRAATQSIFDKFISTTLRWDIFHFYEIARHGYVYEHLYAFLPGGPAIMRASSLILGESLSSGMFWGSWFLVAGCSTLFTLYEITLLETGSQQVAMLATACSILTTSPATLLHAPYAEPFFAFLTFRGILHSTRREWNRAALYFAIAGLFRSNGILFAGFVVWGLVCIPFRQHSTPSLLSIVKATILTGLIATPFLAHLYSGYSQFCEGPSPQLWCGGQLPSIYNHVQAKYWNVGVFKYWTVAQIPNFVIAFPPLAVITWAGWTHMTRRGLADLHVVAYNSGIWLEPPSYSEPVASDVTLLAPGITPHAIHALLFSGIILFASHVQIILRVSSSMPFMSWAVARLWVEHPKVAKWYAAWSILWGVTSLVTWGLFLPPA